MIFKIYVSPHSGFVYNDRELLSKREARFIRRLVRDYRKRGSSAENTFFMWDEVCDSEDKFIRPLAAMADLKIDTIHAYEPCILKEQAQMLLSKIKEVSSYYYSAQELLLKLLKAETIDIKYLPKTSLLCEFLC
jgi:uridine kinase